MHDPKTNYDKIVNTGETFFKNELDGIGNFRFYPNPPKMPEKLVISLSLCAEAMGIDSENYSMYKLRTAYGDNFPPTQITAATKVARPWRTGPRRYGVGSHSWPSL